MSIVSVAYAVTELLSIETARVRLSWGGPAWPHEGGVHVRSLRGPALVATASGTRTAAPEASAPLAVPEEATLTLWAQSRTGEPVTVHHRDPSQIAGLVQADAGRVLHGSIRVRDRAGRSTFVVRVGGRPEVEVSWCVLPTKLSVHEVAQMRAEVEAAWAGGARAAWGSALEPSAPGGPDSAPAWLALLRDSVSRLDLAMTAIRRQPDVDLVRQPEEQRAAHLRGDAASIAAIRKGRGRGAWGTVAGVPVRETVRVGVLRQTEDTAAHRWMRNRLDRALARLAAIRREERGHPYAEHASRRTLGEDLARLDEHLRRLVTTGPLQEVSGARVPRRAPLVLRRRPAYRQAFEALRSLDRGLGVAEGEVEAAWMGTARVFEAWAALAVVQEAAALLGVEAPAEPFGTLRMGASVRVRRGRAASVRLAGDGGALIIAYEPRFGGPPALLAQRPDLLLTLARPDGPTRRAVLDAKYRRDESPAYERRHGAAGPPEDALGDLHRYRDAIVGREGEPLIERAAALFPSAPDETFRDSPLWRSHGTVGIGAVPLAPGAREWLRQWLADWMSKG